MCFEVLVKLNVVNFNPSSDFRMSTFTFDIIFVSVSFSPIASKNLATKVISVLTDICCHVCDGDTKVVCLRLRWKHSYKLSQNYHFVFDVVFFLIFSIKIFKNLTIFNLFVIYTLFYYLDLVIDF